MKRYLKILYAVVLAVGAVALVRDTVSQGQDFEVFYRAGLNVLNQEPVYSLVRDGAMVFKYPPWFAVFFVPLALLSLFWAKLIWGILQVLSLAYVSRWLIKQGVRFERLFLGLVGFWGIWAVHALDGQIMLPWLAVMTGLYENRQRFLSSVASVAVAPVKIFTAFVLLSFRGHFFKDKRTLFWGLFLILVLTYPAYLAQNSESLIGLFRDWADCVRSGDSSFGVEKTFGRENQGIPALIVRVLGAAGLSADKFSLVSILVSLAGFFWATILLIRQKFEERQLFVFVLALIPVFMPLSWFHGFVLVFPAVTMLFKKRLKLGLLIVVLIGAVTVKTVGPFGGALEWASIKSWAAMLTILL